MVVVVVGGAVCYLAGPHTLTLPVSADQLSLLCLLYQLQSRQFLSQLRPSFLEC